MIETNTKREIKKIKELAREYESKGFDVSILPKENAVPKFMRELNFSPDLIAKSNEESYVIEVSSRDSANRLKRLSSIVSAIEKKEGWKFVLVMTNPRLSSIESVKTPMPDIYELRSSYKKLSKLMSVSKKHKNDFDQAIVLLAWSIIEGALRMYNYSGNKKDLSRSQKSVVRDAVMYGFITREEGEFLDYIADIRNRISHGAVETKIRDVSLKKLVNFCDRLVSEV